MTDEAHSKSEYKRRVEQGDTRVRLPGVAAMDRAASVLHQRLKADPRLVSWKLPGNTLSWLATIEDFNASFEQYEFERFRAYVAGTTAGELQSARGVLIHPGPTKLEIKRWMAEARKLLLRGREVVAVLPARVDSIWWRDLVLPYARRVLFLTGRLCLVNVAKPDHEGAGYPSVVVVMYTTMMDAGPIVRWVTIPPRSAVLTG